MESFLEEYKREQREIAEAKRAHRARLKEDLKSADEQRAKQRSEKLLSRYEDLRSRYGWWKKHAENLRDDKKQLIETITALQRALGIPETHSKEGRRDRAERYKEVSRQISRAQLWIDEAEAKQIENPTHELAMELTEKHAELNLLKQERKALAHPESP